MTEDDKKFMRRAIALAEEGMNTGAGGPFGAVVVKDGEIIAEGWNIVTSSNDPTAHAEITAIRRACENLNTFQLENCVLYTSCEPCPMCLGAIYWARPKKVFYALNHSDAAKIGFDDKGNKIKGYTPYMLRGTYATLRLTLGNVDIYKLAKNLGNQVATTEKYYSKARPSDFKESLSKIKK
ncbi:deaminase [Zunongwangia profunda]|uniref:deaminase n=1 Tax=Zunongwangia profunda TaxID=398743 RepID=UPI0030DD7BB8